MRLGIVTRPPADTASDGEPWLPARRTRRSAAPNAECKDFKMEQKLKIAVFIDFDNIEIGVKSTLHREFDVAAVLDALKERGEIVTKFAYANWGRQESATRRAFRARRADGAARSFAARRQERRRHQSGAGRAGNGLHARSHQRLRDCQRRQRFHRAGEQAQTIRQAHLRGGRARLHQHDSAEELPRIRGLRIDHRRPPALGGHQQQPAADGNRSSSRRSNSNRSSSPQQQPAAAPQQQQPQQQRRSTSAWRSTWRRPCRWWNAPWACWSGARCGRSSAC